MNEPLIGNRKSVNPDFGVYNDAAAFDQSRIDISFSALQITRLILFVLHIGLYIAALYLQPFYAQYVYLSYWGLHLSTLSLLFSYLSAASRHNLDLKQWALLLMEMAMTMCVLSAILYWTVIYSDMKNVYKWDNHYDRQFLLFLTALHLLPLISVVINYLLSDVEFLKRDITAIIMLGLLYMLANFIVSKVAG